MLRHGEEHHVFGRITAGSSLGKDLPRFCGRGGNVASFSHFRRRRISKPAPAIRKVATLGSGTNVPSPASGVAAWPVALALKFCASIVKSELSTELS